MSAVDELLEEIYGYSSAALVPLLAKSFRVNFARNRSPQFNARVSIDKQQNYTISIFDGCAEGVLDAIASIGPEFETISDSLVSLCRKLSLEEKHETVLRRFILFNSLLFVVLHELSHVICGHFPFRIDNGLAPATGVDMNFDEIDMSATQASTVPQNEQLLFKQIELDADQMAFEFLVALGYELFVANEEIRQLAGTRHPPDEIPEPVEHALFETMLFAASTVVFLIDANCPAPSFYPSPEARVLNLAYHVSGRFILGSDFKDGEHHLVIDQDVRDRFSTKIIPTVLNALEFGAACYEHRCPPSHMVTGETPTRETALTRDLIRLLVPDGEEFSCRGAGELQGLLAGKGEFLTQVRPYMTRGWKS